MGTKGITSKTQGAAGIAPETVAVLAARVRELEALAFRPGDRVYDVESDGEGEVVRVERRRELVRVVVSYAGDGRRFQAPIALEHVEAGASLEAVLRVLEGIGAVAIGKSLIAELAAALARIDRRLALAPSASRVRSRAAILTWHFTQREAGAIEQLLTAAGVVVQRSREAERASRRSGVQHAARVQWSRRRRGEGGGRRAARASRGMTPPALRPVGRVKKGAEGSQTRGSRAGVAARPPTGGAPSSGTKKGRRRKGAAAAKSAAPAKQAKIRITKKRGRSFHAPKGGA